MAAPEYGGRSQSRNALADDGSAGTVDQRAAGNAARAAGAGFAAGAGDPDQVKIEDIA